MSRDVRSAAGLVERVWYGDETGARAVRLALLPVGALYGLFVAARGRLFERGVLRVQDPPLPAVSIGNLTVGGTGKTPVAAWLAGELRARGARPAIVLRGYGADEPLVHAALNPDIPVVADADRVRGIATARDRGADVAVLDDAFQHRRARRVADVVLISADRWGASRRRLLPAGPWREPLSALRRASLLLVTRKAVDAARAMDVVDAARCVAPELPAALVQLVPEELRAASGRADERNASRSLARLDGATVFAISAIGDSSAFHAQLVGSGARLAPPPAAFPDHHPFDAPEAARLARAGERAEYVLCTLKDAVKLAPLWPRAGPPLWYVSQRVAPEWGASAVEHVLEVVIETVLAAQAPASRHARSSTADADRPTDTAHGHRPPSADR